MKTVVLTLGPRGAGKTTFCKEVVRVRPEIALVERDAVLVELFGSSSLDLYEGSHKTCLRKALLRVEYFLHQESAVVIFDTWTEVSEYRKRLVQHLRTLGAGRVVGWNFITPEDDVVRQFIAREDTPTSPWRYTSPDAVRSYSRQYRERLVGLDEIFDHLVEINPKQQRLFPVDDSFF